MNELTRDCARWREVVSAALDGEATPDEEQALEDHLRSCPVCRTWRREAQALGRTLRVREAEAVPDQTAAILARADEDTDRRSLRWALRLVLGAIGLLEVVFALGDFVDESGTVAFLHAERHSGAFALAFAVALIVVAVQPDRVRGLLPMGLVLAGVLVATSVADLAQGRSPAFGELRHLLELGGVALMALLARVQRQHSRPGHGGRHRLDDADAASSPGTVAGTEAA